MLAHEALVVVADGQSALLLRNMARRGVYLAEVMRISSDRLDMASNGIAPERMADKNSDGFAISLADRLNAMARENEFDDIVILATPEVLGVLRRRYHKELLFRMRCETDGNLVNADVRDISAMLI